LTVPVRLRPYQQKALTTFTESSARSVLLVAPTGAGKGTIASVIMSQYARSGRRVLFLVHRRELVHNMVGRLRGLGISVAQTLYSDRKVRVVSVQAALRMRIQPVDLLVVDEAHHYAADEWQSVVSRCKATRVIGFTATPERADGRPLGDMFEQIVEVASYSELIRRGYIVPCRVLRPQRRMDSTEIAQDPVDAYLEYAKGERTLIFVRRIVEAQAVADRLSKEGVPTGVVTSKTKKEDRDQTMLRLENGDLDVVVNVGVLTEGVDVPHVTHVVLARPCSHASTYLQIVGRALRAAEGKRMATLIDLVGASYKHGLPAEDRVYQLEGDHGIDTKDNRSGPSGPSGPRGEDLDIENLGLDLLEIMPRGLEYLRKLPLPEPEPEPLVTAPDPTMDEPKRRRRVWTTGEVEQRANGRWRPVPVTKKRADLTPEERRLKFTPKRGAGRPPVERTEGFLFQDRGFWQLSWRERGKKLRTGLATRNEAEAQELLAYFRKHGPNELKEEVRMRRRYACCLDTRTDVKNKNFAIVTWNGDKTKMVRTSIGTDNLEEAQELLELYKAKKFEEFDRRVEANLAAAKVRARQKLRTTMEQKWKRIHAAAAGLESAP
jgi:DNA repair protein RadD